MPNARASVKMADAEIDAQLQPLLAAFRSQIRADLREELERFFHDTRALSKSSARHADDEASAQLADSPTCRRSARLSCDSGIGKPRKSRMRASAARSSLHKVMQADSDPAGDNHLHGSSDRCAGGSPDRYHLTSKHGVEAMLKRKEKRHTHGQRKTARMSSQYQRLIIQDAPNSGDESTFAEDEGKRVDILPLLESIVFSWKFDLFTAIAVLFNALTIGLETEYQCRHIGEPLPDFFWFINAFIGIVFGIEVFLKICVYRKSFFCGESWQWNLFDLSLVIEMAAQSCGLLGANFHVVGFLRLARLARLGRLFNLVEEMQTITLYVASAVHAMFWALLVLLILLYSVAICFTQLVLLNMDSTNDGEMDDLLYWFGTVSRTNLTLFECIAGGVSWDEVAQPLIVHISPFAGLGLCIFIAFVVFAILNVMTGVVLDTATRFARAEEDRLTARSICNAFNLDIDDVSREINCDEFAECLSNQNMQAYFETIDVDTDDAATLFELVDNDSNGGVNALELISALMHLRGSAKAKHLAVVAQDTRRILEWTQNHMYYAEEMDNIRHRLDSLEHSYSPRADGCMIAEEQSQPRNKPEHSLLLPKMVPKYTR